MPQFATSHLVVEKQQVLLRIRLNVSFFFCWLSCPNLFRVCDDKLQWSGYWHCNFHIQSGKFAVQKNKYKAKILRLLLNVSFFCWLSCPNLFSVCDDKLQWSSYWHCNLHILGSKICKFSNFAVKKQIEGKNLRIVVHWWIFLRNLYVMYQWSSGQSLKSFISITYILP